MPWHSRPPPPFPLPRPRGAPFRQRGGKRPPRHRLPPPAPPPPPSGQGWIYSAGGTGALAASTSPTVNYIVATSTSATSTFAGGFSVGSTYLNVLQNGRVGIGTAAPSTGLDIGVATKISGDLTLSGGSALTISATGPVNQTGTGQVTFAGNVDATNGLDVTNANFTVGGSNFTVAQSTGNTIIAGTLGLTGAFNASSTLQATAAARLYSTLQADGAITAAGAGTGLSVTNNASTGGAPPAPRPGGAWRTAFPPPPP